MIKISYCEACGELQTAEKLQNKILKKFDVELDEIELVPCGRCSFNVKIDGNQVHSQKSHLEDLRSILDKLEKEVGNSPA